MHKLSCCIVVAVVVCVLVMQLLQLNVNAIKLKYRMAKVNFNVKQTATTGQTMISYGKRQQQQSQQQQQQQQSQQQQQQLWGQQQMANDISTLNEAEMRTHNGIINHDQHWQYYPTLPGLHSALPPPSLASQFQLQC